MSRRNCFGDFDAQFLQFGEKTSEKKSFSLKTADLLKLLVRSTDEIQTQISFLTVPVRANFCKLSKQSTLILESLTSHVLLLTSILAKLLTS